MEPRNIPVVTNLMRTLKPEWWDYEDALEQLSGKNENIETVGWYLVEDENHPKVWMICHELANYRAIDLECSGYDNNGIFEAEHKLGQLFEVGTKYAQEKGYLTFRSGISSTGFNIHGKDIVSIPKAIELLTSERVDYKWYLENGFRVIEIQPNFYEKGFDLIRLGKEIQPLSKLVIQRTCAN